MPHSLYLGSGLVQARLKDYDIKWIPQAVGKHSIEEPIQEDITVHEEDDNLTPIATPLIQHQEQPGFEKDDESTFDGDDEEDDHYRPSIHAIKDTMSYTIVELVISLFTVALLLMLLF